MTQSLAVVADIGGTNTRVALADGATLRRETVQRFRNAEHSGIVPILTGYLAQQGVSVAAAAVDLAGPVKDGIGTLTNLDWRVDRDEIAAATGAKTVAVINDMQAQGHALAHLSGDSLQPVRAGAASTPGATRLVVNVGTGLNAALVVHTAAGTVVPASESGHINLPVQDEADLRLLDFLARAHGFAGAEEALSGRGIVNLYAWLCDDAQEPFPGYTAAQIVAACQHKSDPRAVEAMALFVRLLGRYTGNLALIHLPFGGIYFCGGVAAHIAPFLEPLGFEAAFLDKGRFSDYMRQFPVQLVTDDYSALTGSAGHLAELVA
ncbi:MAG: ROK family protein [Roseivivax sp.]|nr:ROK family protein [Roseivivax sp.]